MFRRSLHSAFSKLKGSTRFFTSSVAQAYSNYASLLTTHPLSTKAVTAGVIAAVGDSTCQLVTPSEPAQPFDPLRTFKFSLIGACFTGPSLHIWYGFLQRHLPSASTKSVLTRLAFDQLMFSPLFLATFLSIILTLDGKWNEIGQKLRADYIPTLKACLTVWVPATFFNFKFVPYIYQVTLLHSVSFISNIGL